MKKPSTKDRILDAALQLFSEKGYDGVGVDLIASTIGIKGPSLYRYFKGKEDILNELINKLDAYYTSRFGSSNTPGKVPETMDELIAISTEKIRFTMADPSIKMVRRIFMKEQFRNPRIAELATLHQMDGLCGMYGDMFCRMMENGVMKKADPSVLAMEFIAPVTLLIQANDRQPEREAEYMERIRQHLAFFAATYGVK